MIDNPCACCSEYDPDIGAPCFFLIKVASVRSAGNRLKRNLNGCGFGLQGRIWNLNKKTEGLIAPLFLFPHVLLRKLIFFVLAYIRFLV